MLQPLGQKKKLSPFAQTLEPVAPTTGIGGIPRIASTERMLGLAQPTQPTFRSRQGKGAFGTGTDFARSLAGRAQKGFTPVVAPQGAPSGKGFVPQTTLGGGEPPSGYIPGGGEGQADWLETGGDWTSQYGDLFSRPYASPDEYYYPQYDPLGQEFGWAYDEKLFYWTGPQRKEYDAKTQLILSIKHELKKKYGTGEFYEEWPWTDDDYKNKELTVDGTTHTLEQWRWAVEKAGTERKALKDEWEAEFGDEDKYYPAFDFLFDWFAEGWDQESSIEPFQSEWDDLFTSVFGEMAGLPSSTDFLTDFIEQFAIDKIATGEIDPADYGFDQWSPEFFQYLIDQGIEIPGFNFDQDDPDTTSEQQFIQYLMNLGQSILTSIEEYELDLSQGFLGSARTARLQAAMRLFNQPGLSKEEADILISSYMEPLKEESEVKKQAHRQQSGLGLMGDSGAAIRKDRWLDRDIAMAEAQIRSDVIRQDMQLRQQNMALATSELGSLSQQEIDAMTTMMGINATREANVLGFLANVGSVAVGSKGTEYEFFTHRLALAQEHWKDSATLNLTKELELAGLDLEMFDITTSAGVEQMKARLEAALRNRGMNIEEAKANAANTVATYQMGLSFAEMDLTRLATMAELAAKGQAGDRQAWGMYQGMLLEENLKNRGMDIQQAGMLADLTFGMWSQDKKAALIMWQTKYRAQIDIEIAKIQAGEESSKWFDIAGTLFNAAGYVIGSMFGSNDENPDEPGEPGDPGGGG